MLNKPMAVLLAFTVYSSNFCFVDAAPSEKQLSRRETTPEERLVFGIVPALIDTVAEALHFVGLDVLVNVIDQLGISGLLKPTLGLVAAILLLPAQIFINPANAYESLFGNLTYVTSEVQQLAVDRLTCTGCFFLVGLIQFLQALKFSDDDIANTVVDVCVTLQLYPQRVCEGVVEKQKTILLFCTKNTPYNLGQICAHLVGYGCGTEPEQGKWKVTLPRNKPPVTPVPPPQPGAEQLTIIHITDPHVDLNYTEGSPSGCKEPLCCRSDSPADSSNMVSGTYGGQPKCDLRVSTLELMLQDAKSRYPNPDIIFLTGDLPPHDVWTETQEVHMYDNSLVTKKVKDYFPTAIILPAIGNHDSAPSNNFPPRITQIPERFNIDWLYDQMVELWTPWLSQSALETVKKGGYYSIETAHPGLRVISINSNICYFVDFWILINATDPMGELAWLVQELIVAEANNEKVIIIMHIPPGYDDCVRVWSSNFYDIVNRFESTIVGQFSGHTHLDHFMVYYERTTGRATNVMYVCPSTTSHENLNLAYRVIKMDGTPHGSYDAYDMPSMQPSAWDDVITKISTYDKYWQRFFTYLHRNSSVYPGCDASCKQGLVCQLQSASSRDPTQCSAFGGL